MNPSEERSMDTLTIQPLLNYMRRICQTEEELLKIGSMETEYYRFISDMMDFHTKIIEYKTELEGRFAKLQKFE